MKLKQIFFISIALFFPVFKVFAQMLENIPGQSSVENSDLIGYLNNLYKFGISITGILAIFMIGVGAFAYIVTSVGNSSKMMDAKEKIQNALIGLVIALTAYLLLYVINPDLVGGTLSAPSTAITAVITTTTATLTDGTECNDMSGPNPGGGTSPGAPLCSGGCINGFHTDVTTGKVVCGQPTASTVGCCITDPSEVSGCQANLTKFECDQALGAFVSGASLTCVDQAFIGVSMGCE